jgi:hypothetical protein
MAGCKRDKSVRLSDEKWTGENYKRVGLSYDCESRFDFTFGPGIDNMKLNPERVRGFPHVGKLAIGS